MPRRGVTIREVAVVLCCAIAIVVLLAMFLSRERRDHQANKDSTYLRSIHQCWLVGSREFNGIYPTPGLARRLPDPVLGLAPGHGPEDVAQNTTANLYSLCIMNNYVPPELCVGPTEPSAHVSVCDAYDFEAYKPAANVYWDTKFRADLHEVSHVSYAHVPIVGDFKLKHWRDSRDPSAFILGNRGPINGKDDPKSITYRIHKPFDRWSGNVVFNDGSVKFFESMNPGGVPGGNFFAPPSDDIDDGGFLAFTKSIGEAGAGGGAGGGLTIEHD